MLAKMIEDLVEIKVYDAQFYDYSQEHFLGILNEFNPDYVGISSLTSEYDSRSSINKNWIPIRGL